MTLDDYPITGDGRVFRGVWYLQSGDSTTNDSVGTTHDIVEPFIPGRMVLHAGIWIGTRTDAPGWWHSGTATGAKYLVLMPYGFATEEAALMAARLL